MKNILEIADLVGGGTPSKLNETYWNGNIPFFTPSDFSSYIFAMETLESISKEGLNSSSTKLFSKGTIFLTARGSVGNLMIASRDMSMNQSCYALRAKDSKYIFVYFSTINIIGYLKAKSSGSVFNSIVSNDIKNTPVIIPTNILRDRFEFIAKPLFEKILINLKQNQELAQLREWLLPMLMNGQVKVESDLN